MTSAVGICGPGQGLPYPQYNYPSNPPGADLDIATNNIALNPGEAFPVPRGNWYMAQARYLVTEYLDPVSGQWRWSSNGAFHSGADMFIASDGYNYRIANMTGCVVGAVVTAAGSGFTSNPTLTLSVGSGTTILPVIGGAVSLNTIVFPGANYGLPPILAIPAPTFGVPAVAYALLANGTVSAVSFISQGAGYTAPPSITVITNPADPNIATIGTLATITTSLTSPQALTGAIVTNPGAPLTSVQVTNGAFSIAVAGGGGSNATVVAVVMQTIISASVTAGGGGYGSGAGTAAPYLTTFGGIPNTGSTLASPESKLLAWTPRQAQIALNTSGAGASIQISTAGNIWDGGLFLGAPNPVVIGGTPTTAASVVLTLGGVPDYFGLQPTN